MIYPEFRMILLVFDRLVNRFLILESVVPTEYWMFGFRYSDQRYDCHSGMNNPWKPDVVRLI